MRRLGVASAAIAAVAMVAPACFPQGQCDGVFTEYCAAGDPNCQGHIVSATQWESGPISGKWLSFGPEGLYLIHLRDAQTGQVLSGTTLQTIGYVGAVETPDTIGNNYAPCAGNLCEFTDNDSSSFYVRNDTCSTEFFRFVVTLDPATASISDGGAE